MPSITRRRASDSGRRPSAAEADVLAATQRLLINGANFTELGVQQISAEAGVARSTFYAHFRDKTDLIMRLATTMLSTSFGIGSGWEPAGGAEGFANAFLQIVAVYREHYAVLRALWEVATYDATAREFWNEQLAPFRDRTIALLRREQEAGRAPADLDIVSASRVIVMGGDQAIFDHVTAGKPSDDAAFARELALIWWYGAFRRPMT